MRRSATAVAGIAMLATLISGATAASAVQTVQPGVVSANPADWTPQIKDGSAHAILQVGNTVYIGGVFTTVNSANGKTVATRTDMFAVDATTGAISSFAPALNGEVDAIAAGADGTLYIGGQFTTVGGVKSKGIARINASTGALATGWKSPYLNGNVADIAIVNGKPVIGGNFLKSGTTAVPPLVALNPVTGAVDTSALSISFAGPLRGGALKVAKMSLSPDGTKLAVIGNFSSVGGQSRNQLAILDVSVAGGAVTAWSTTGYAPDCSTSFDTYLRDVEFSPDGSYFVIATTGGAHGNLCDSVARWDLTGATGTTPTSATPTWVDYTGGDTTYSIANTGTAVYVGGHFRWMNNSSGADSAGPGAVARSGIAALDPVNGLPLSWNPGRTRGVGVFDMLATSTGLWVGSDTTTLGGEYHARLGFFPLAGGTTVPQPAAATLPGTAVLLSSTLSSSSDTLRRAGLTTSGASAPVSGDAGGIAWSNVRGATLIDNTLYTGWSDGNLYARTVSGTSFGTATAVDLHGLTAFASEIRSMTSMYYANGRLYYTLSGSSALYYRYFTTEDRVVGNVRYTASGNLSDLDFSTVRGAFVAGGALYYVTSSGRFYSAALAGNVPVAGTSKALAGYYVDGTNWFIRGMYFTAG